MQTRTAVESPRPADEHIDIVTQFFLLPFQIFREHLFTAVVPRLQAVAVRRKRQFAGNEHPVIVPAVYINAQAVFFFIVANMIVPAYNLRGTEPQEFVLRALA